MVGGTWLVVPHPWASGSTLGISLEQSFIQIAANGSSEPKVPNAAGPRNGRDLCRAGFSVAEFRSESNLIVPLDRQRDYRWRKSAKLSLKFPSG